MGILVCEYDIDNTPQCCPWQMVIAAYGAAIMGLPSQIAYGSCLVGNKSSPPWRLWPFNNTVTPSVPFCVMFKVLAQELKNAINILIS